MFSVLRDFTPIFNERRKSVKNIAHDDLSIIYAEQKSVQAIFSLMFQTSFLQLSCCFIRVWAFRISYIILELNNFFQTKVTVIASDEKIWEDSIIFSVTYFYAK